MNEGQTSGRDRAGPRLRLGVVAAERGGPGLVADAGQSSGPDLSAGQGAPRQLRQAGAPRGDLVRKNAGAAPGGAMQRGSGPVPAARRQGGAATRPLIDLDELWAPEPPARIDGDRTFLPGALVIEDRPASPVRFAFNAALLGLLAAALAWSWFGHIDSYANATGKIQASGRTKVVQPLEAGSVIAIKAQNGDRVRQNDVLAELDPTDALADQTIARNNLINDQAEIVRRRTEILAAGKTPIDVKPAVAWPDHMASGVRSREEAALRADLAALKTTMDALAAQKAEKQAEWDRYRSSIGPEEAVIALVGEHAGMSNDLFKGGWDSRATLIALLEQLQNAKLQLTTLQGNVEQAKAAIPVIESQMAQTLQNFLTSATQSLVLAQHKEDELVQILAKATSKLNHMTLRASTSGVIEASTLTSLGQVVTPGLQVMQIVPEASPLEIECYVQNTDAGFIKPGQEAMIKVDTFPFTRYGTVKGRVVKVARDALPGNQKGSSTSTLLDGAMAVSSAAQQTSDLVFPVTVEPLQTSVVVDGRRLPITSGMTATVEIKTESRRAIDYVLAPIKAVLATAAQER